MLWTMEKEKKALISILMIKSKVNKTVGNDILHNVYGSEHPGKSHAKRFITHVVIITPMFLAWASIH